MPSFRLARSGACCLLAVAALAGCDQDVLDPDVTGSVDAVLRDAPPDGGATHRGTAAGDVAVSLRSEGGSWVELGSLNGITVQLHDTAGTSVHGAQDLPAGRYVLTRLTLSALEVKVDSGSVVGGTTLARERSTTLAADGPVVVERELAGLTVEEGSSARLVFALSSADWLDRTALDSGVVADSVVRAAVTVGVEGG